MRKCLIIFESTRYDVFLDAETPNLDDLGELHKAYTHGSWTRPSITSILSGYLPSSDVGQPFKPSWVYMSEEVFNHEKFPVHFLNGNAWVKNLHPRRYEDRFYPDKHSGPKMIEDALEIIREETDFFLILFLVESHIPYDLSGERKEEVEAIVKLFKEYNEGLDNRGPEIAYNRSMQAISYLDDLIKPLLNLDVNIIFTSDHGELMGEKHKIGHDPSFPFHQKLIEVPLIIGEV